MVLISIFGPGPLCAAGIPDGLNAVKEDVYQAVVVQTEDGIKARVSTWERGGATGWRQASGPMDAVIGRNGLAPEGTKREGDGRTPAGIFNLRRAFGYADHVETGLSYTPVGARDFWVDDPQASQYNQWVHGHVPEVSHEVLRRGDALYEYAVVVEYNTGPVVPGLGSAIFLHVWRGPGHPTAGCVAMAPENILSLLRWLDLRHNPVILLR